MMKPMLDETVTVVENRPLTGGHFLLGLHSPRQARATRPGQFAMLRLLERSDVLLRRPMSIYDVKPSRARDRKKARGQPEVIELLYKVVGRGTRLMAELKSGDRVGLLAPLGHGFFEEEYLRRAEEADEVLQVAGGIGIAALLLPARALARGGFRQRLFFGGGDQRGLGRGGGLPPRGGGGEPAPQNGCAGPPGLRHQAPRRLSREPAQQEILPDGVRPLGHAPGFGRARREVSTPVPGLHGKPDGLRPRRVPGLLHSG